MTRPVERAALAEWRRIVSETYALIRRTRIEEQYDGWRSWRQTRDQLFKGHSQSPLDEGQREVFESLNYFDHDPAWRLEATLEPAAEMALSTIELTDDGTFNYTRIGIARFDVEGVPYRLNVYWIEGYGGGLFLPFKDLTNGRTTFGGGRYLYDTIKGADLTVTAHEILLDFNYAYNPSCAYNARWVCPLTPYENSLPLEITAGELDFPGFKLT